MSQSLISLNPDLKQLWDDGFQVEVRNNHLVVHAIPYVNAQKEVAIGALISELNLVTPEQVGPPSSHQLHFVGTQPCNQDGSPITQLGNGGSSCDLGGGLVASFYFSFKLRGGYTNYHQKVTNYVSMITAPALAKGAKDPRTHRVPVPPLEDSVFQYLDTASSRAGIEGLTAKLKPYTIAIVGAGGTGMYLLDLLAKTPVRHITIFDGDVLMVHNAFRMPGAVSAETLRKRLPKVEYAHQVYSNMHRVITPRNEMVSEHNVQELKQFDFVFIAIDHGPSRKLIADTLSESDVPFVDVGMGLEITKGQKLLGTVRVTTSLPADRATAAGKLPTTDRQDDIYASNIQTVEMNALNAVLAVIKWKKLSGFYHDDSEELHSTYNTAMNKTFWKAGKRED